MKIHPSVDKAEKHFLPSGSSVIHSSGGNRQKKKSKIYNTEEIYTYIEYMHMYIWATFSYIYMCVYIYILHQKYRRWEPKF